MHRELKIPQSLHQRVTEGACYAGDNCRAEPRGEYDGNVANALLQIAYAAKALKEGRFEDALTYGRLCEGFQRQGRERASALASHGDVLSSVARTALRS